MANDLVRIRPDSWKANERQPHPSGDRLSNTPGRLTAKTGNGLGHECGYPKVPDRNDEDVTFQAPPGVGCLGPEEVAPAELG